ncbi:MAG: FAD-dependent oxidoreductase [Patescibacteria group bacterium]
MNIAVIGGGIFGTTAAWMLAQDGHQVDLYEKEHDILRAASGINQYRLHQGYHYPRSKETILTAQEGQKSFRAAYGEAVIEDPVKHYYCVAKEKSFLSASQCGAIWDECQLPYEKTELNLINKDNIELAVRVSEQLIDPEKLRELCWQKLRAHGVNVLLNTEAKENELGRYDFVIVATYASNNAFLSHFAHAKKHYQFELCEKPVLELPAQFANKSIMVLDGPFMNINPFGRTNHFVMGHVEHAIHHKNIGEFPEIPDSFKPLLNRGVIANPPVTNIKKMLSAAEQFFPGIEKGARHIGSMFTIRTVPPYREHDDARPTLVEQINNKLVLVFSGKIVTCVDAAREIRQCVRRGSAS